MIGLFFGMDARFLLALCLLCVLEVDCQTSPHLSFGSVLPNHSYVDLGMVGTTLSNSVQCHTDLSDNHNGQWYFPNGDPCKPRVKMVIFISLLQVRELTYVAEITPIHQLAYIIVKLLSVVMLMEPEFMWDCISMEVSICLK